MSEEPEISITELDSETVEAFWTDEAMVGAEAEEPTPSDGFEGADRGEESVYGDPEAIAGVAPDGDTVSMGNLTGGYPCDVMKVGNASLAPFCRAGRLFYTLSGTRYWTSAATVGDRVVLTWAGALYRRGEWSTNIQFRPGYPDMGSVNFSGIRSVVFSGWKTGEDKHYAYGMLKTNRSVTKQIGHFGLAWNQTKNGRSWEIYAYPSYAPHQMYTKAHYLYPKNTLMAIGNNNFRAGALGAPWATRIPDYGLCVNGVQAGQFGSCNAESPYFDANVKRLWDAAGG